VEVLESHQKTLEIPTRAIGSQHPDVASSYSNLRIMYVHGGDIENALLPSQEVQEIRTHARI
jgi:hypothetical protein